MIISYFIFHVTSGCEWSWLFIIASHFWLVKAVYLPSLRNTVLQGIRTSSISNLCTVFLCTSWFQSVSSVSVSNVVFFIMCNIIFEPFLLILSIRVILLFTFKIPRYSKVRLLYFPNPSEESTFYHLIIISSSVRSSSNMICHVGELAIRNSSKLFTLLRTKFSYFLSHCLVFRTHIFLPLQVHGFRYGTLCTQLKHFRDI